MNVERRWRPQKYIAALISAVMVLVPILAAVLAGSLLANALPEPLTTLGVVMWWMAVVGGSFFAAWLADNIIRRFAPIPGLWRMTLVFPDKAPSRFGIALRSTNVSELRRRIASAEENQDLAVSAETILALATALSSHDRKTRGHSERTRAYTDLIADELGLSEAAQDRLRWAALLHDIGKLEIPEEVLNKSGPLTAEEFNQIKRHPIAGMRIASPLVPWLGAWADTIAHHHEKWDGTGYPQGLSGEEISLGGRIVAVADAYDVMTAGRTYQTAKSPEAAREEVTSMAGHQFDPRVARALMSVSIGKLIWLRPLGWFASLPFVGGIDRFFRDLGKVASAGVAVLALLIAGVLPGIGDDGPPTFADTATTVAARDNSPPETNPPATVSIPPPDTEPPTPLPESTTTSLPPPTPQQTSPPATTPPQPPGSTFPLDLTTTTASTTTTTSTSTTTTTTTAPVITVSPPPTTIPLTVEPDSERVTAGEDAVVITPIANDSGNNLTVAAVGSAQLGTVTHQDESPTFTYLANNGATGVDNVTYDVCDTWGVCDTGNVRIEVAAPDRPIPTPDEGTVRAGEISRIDVIGNDNGQQLKVRSLLSSETTVANIETDLGRAEIIGDDTIAYRAHKSVSGTDTIRYRVCDRNGDCGVARLTVTVNPQPRPLVEPDEGRAAAGESVIFDVLANDNGDRLRVARITEPPRSGEASVAQNGNGVAYTAALVSPGRVGFEYEVCDNDGHCARARVNVTINTPPGPEPSPDQAEVEAAESTVIPVLANDTGQGLRVDSVDQESRDRGNATVTADGKRIRYNAKNQPGQEQFSYTVCDRYQSCAATNVTMTIRPRNVPQPRPDNAQIEVGITVVIDVVGNDEGTGLVLDRIVEPPSLGDASVTDDGQVRYKARDESGEDIFRYRVCDEDGDCARGRVQVHVVLPELKAQPDTASVIAGETITVDVLANDSGDGLHIDRITQQGDDIGRATITDDGQRIRYSARSKPGTDHFTYRVCDRHGTCAQTSVTVEVRAMTAPDQASVVSGEAKPIDVLANDPGKGLMIESIVGDPQLGHATVTHDQRIRYKAHPNRSGNDVFGYRVCNPNGVCASEKVTVKVKPQSTPQTEPDSAEVRAHRTTSIYVLGNDNGDQLSVEATRGVDLGRASVANGSVVVYEAGHDPGVDTFEYQACDGDGDCVWEQIEVTVTPNYRPVAADDVVNGTPGATHWVDVLANDTNADGDPLTVRIVNQPGYVTASVVNNQVRVELRRQNPPRHWNTDVIGYEVCDPDNLCDAAKVTIRLVRRWDTGSPRPNDTPSGWWDADPIQGRSSTTGDAIANTTDDLVYQSEQFGPGESANGNSNSRFAYRFDVRPGRWQIRLHLAEIYWENDRQRVFDVMVNNDVVIDEMDIHAEVGANRALIKTITSDVLVPPLVLGFDASVDNPSIVGIELIPAHETIFELIQPQRHEDPHRT